MSSLSSSDKNILQQAREILSDNFQHFKKYFKEKKIEIRTPKWDLLCFQIYTLLTRNAYTMNRWSSFWEKYSEKKEFKGMVYKVPEIYKPFLNKNSQTENLFLLLNEKQNYRWKEFMEIFFSLRNQIYPRLPSREFEVLIAMTNRQTSSITEVGRALDMDRSNTLRYINSIKQKGLIYEGITVNVSKLKLIPYILILQNPTKQLKKKTKVFEKLESFRNYYESYIGNYYLLSYHIINEKEKEIKLLEYEIEIIKKELKPEKIIKLKLDRTKRLKSFNYASYNNTKGSWNNSLLEYLSYDDEKLMEQNRLISEFSDYKPSLVKLNKNGVDILKYIIKTRDISQSRIKRQTNLSLTTIRNYLDYFIKEEVFVRRITPQPIFGLSTLLVYFQTESHKQKSLHLKLSFLPEIYSEPFQMNSVEGIFFTIKLPSEHITNILDLMNSVISAKNRKYFLIDNIYKKKRPLNYDYYDTLLKKWIK
ncbi:MAG: hypothetical protein ACTSP3_03270 [Candidatus Heimdallarchaeaceae archaeon]